MFVEGVKGSIHGDSIACQENDDMFNKEDMFVEHISVTQFKKKLDEIYIPTESPIRVIMMMRCWSMINFLAKYMRTLPYIRRIAPNVLDEDELTLAQSQRLELTHEWPFWLEAIRKQYENFINQRQ